MPRLLSHVPLLLAGVFGPASDIRPLRARFGREAARVFASYGPDEADAEVYVWGEDECVCFIGRPVTVFAPVGGLVPLSLPSARCAVFPLAEKEERSDEDPALLGREASAWLAQNAWRQRGLEGRPYHLVRRLPGAGPCLWIPLSPMA